jgi:hypothetical protein
MSWLKMLDIGLDVANAFISEHNATKLKELQMQGATAAFIEAIIKELRNQIFNYKQTAETILANETESPVIAAGAMKLLERRLADSGITPEVFQEITDKEYTATVIRLIRENSDRMFRRLSEGDRTEVARVASVASRLQDYNFYVDNYQKGKDLQKATEVIRTYKNRQGCLPIVGIILYIYPGIAFPALLSIGLGGGSEAGQAIVGMIGFGLWIWGLVNIFKWRNGGGYKVANKVVEKYGEEFNLDYFNSLEKELGNVEEIKKRRKEAQRVAGNFFKDSSLFQTSYPDLEVKDTSILVQDSISSFEDEQTETPSPIEDTENTQSSQHIILVASSESEKGDLPSLHADDTKQLLPAEQDSATKLDVEKIKNAVIVFLSVGMNKTKIVFSNILTKIKEQNISLPNFLNNKKRLAWGAAVIGLILIGLLIGWITRSSTSRLKPAPTQDNAIIFTQAVETALASLPTNIPSPTNTPVQAQAPTSTPYIELSAQKEWSIESGEFYILGSSSGGNLYGLTKSDNSGNSKYFILSSKGEVISQSLVTGINCTRGNEGRHSIYQMSFLVRYDGSIICVQNDTEDVLIKPSNLPEPITLPYKSIHNMYISDSILSSYFPEKDHNERVLMGFHWSEQQSSNQLAWGDGRQIYLSQQAIGFSDGNNNFITINYPSDFDITRNLLWSPQSGQRPELINSQILLMPWDDIYMYYPIYDSPGNRAKDKIIRINANNEITELQKLPSHVRFPDNQYVYKADYLPENQELFILEGSLLYRLNKNLDTLDTYKMPDTLEAGYWFIGHDYAIYEWKNGIISKYKLVSEKTDSPELNFPTPTLSAPITVTDTSYPTSIVCANFNSQLESGIDAKVVTDAINIREKPGTTQTVVGVIYTGEKVKLYNEPPICSEDYLWWKIKAINSGITGWAVEGTVAERWLSP